MRPGPLQAATRRSSVIALAALVQAACAGGSSGSSAVSASGASSGSSSNAGSTTGAFTSNSSGSISGGETSGSAIATGGDTGTGSGAGSSGGTSSGSTTGAFVDAGCNIGNPHGVPIGTVCLFPFDCDCGLLCAPDITGGTQNLVCQAPCASDSDCPLSNETCQKDAGLCLGGLLGSCTRGGADLEFYACTVNSDCPCPYGCYPDPAIGAACERVCDDDSDCHPLTYCNERMGSCQRSCGTPVTLPNQATFLGEFLTCVNPTDCLCPLGCYADARRGKVCESPCDSDLDCADAGEFCETDAGSCQSFEDCYGGDAGLPLFHPCVNSSDCVCPLTCVDDPALTPAGASPPLKFCEACSEGVCQSVPASCQSPAVSGEFQTSGYLACTRNDQCTCPNHCEGSVQLGGLRCEQDCAKDTDCDDPGQFCRSGQCVANTCAAPLACDLVNGQDSPPDAGDGTCFVSPPLNLPLCHAPGLATDACDPKLQRADPDGVCSAGLACAAGEDGGTHCVAVCASGTDCADGDTCVPSLFECLPFDDGGNCFHGGPPIEFSACGGGTICECGYDCVNGACEQRCQRDSDCNDPALVCFGTVAQSYCVL